MRWLLHGGWGLLPTGLAVLGLIALGGLGAAAWSSPETPALNQPSALDQMPPPNQPSALPVNVLRLETAERTGRRRTFAGVVKARRASDLSFDRTGRLVEVLVDEGQVVRQGEPLARLDQRNLIARQQETAARRDAEQARLEELEAGPREEVISAARAEVAALEAQLQLLTANHRRSQQLIQDGSVSQGQFDETSYGQAGARARLDVARHRLAELEAGTRPEQLKAQRAVVAQLDSALRDIEVDLEDSVLLAPFEGTIGERFADEGTVVAPGAPIVRLVESVRLEAWIGLPVWAADALEPGESQRVEVGGRVLESEVQAILPELDATTRTRTVIFQLNDAPSRSVVPGQVARVTVTEQVESDGFWVPTAALYRGRRGLWSALVVPPASDGEAPAVERRDVEVLHTDGERSLVRGTLRRDERIVVSGTHRLAPGQRVRVPSAGHVEATSGGTR